MCRDGSNFQFEKEVRANFFFRNGPIDKKYLKLLFIFWPCFSCNLVGQRLGPLLVPLNPSLSMWLEGIKKILIK